jgi:hypothetical protein
MKVKWKKSTGKENNILFSVTKIVNISRVIKARIRIILTAFSAIARCMPLEMPAAAIFVLQIRESKTVQTVFSLTNDRIMAM